MKDEQELRIQRKSAVTKDIGNSNSLNFVLFELTVYYIYLVKLTSWSLQYIYVFRFTLSSKAKFHLFFLKFTSFS